MTTSPELCALAQALEAGGRRELAQAITLVESERPLDRVAAAELIEHLQLKPRAALRLGISGPPGVGKSTLIDALGSEYLARGHKVAVLAIDPSSEISGGSLLGDKLRMPRLARDARAYVRPSPARSVLGGVAARTQEACVLCAAAGFDVIIVETVGVGQSEHAAKDVVDCLLVLVLPRSGDEIQGMKRGLLEHADVLVVNKCDGDSVLSAEHTRQELASAVHLTRTGSEPPVLAVSALEATGLDALLTSIETTLDAYRRSGELEHRAANRAAAWTTALVREAVLERYFGDPARRAELDQVLAEVRAQQLSSQAGLRRVLELWFGRDSS